MDNKFIRGNKSKMNFYQDLSYDEKQVNKILDEVLEKFRNKYTKVDFEKEYECTWIGGDEKC